MLCAESTEEQSRSPRSPATPSSHVKPSVFRMRRMLTDPGQRRATNLDDSPDRVVVFKTSAPVGDSPHASQQRIKFRESLGSLQISPAFKINDDFDKSPVSAPVLLSNNSTPLRSSFIRRFSSLNRTSSFDTSSPASASPTKLGRVTIVGRRLSGSWVGGGGSGGNGSFASLPKNIHEIQMLSTILQHEENRNKLVELLLAAHSKELAVSIRFIGGVHDWQHTVDKKKRQQKAKKLVSLFVSNSSCFKLKDIPVHLEKPLLHGQSSGRDLLHLKEHVLSELTRHNIVSDYIKNFGLNQEETRNEVTDEMPNNPTVCI